jgi:hypothetical protein
MHGWCCAPGSHLTARPVLRTRLTQGPGCPVPPWDKVKAEAALIDVDALFARRRVQQLVVRRTGSAWARHMPASTPPQRSSTIGRERPKADDRIVADLSAVAEVEEGATLKTVMLYPGSARFAGTTNFDWASPTVGSTHRFILFFAQDDSVPDHDVAERELQSLGFSEIDLGEGRRIDVESLNDPKMAAFRRHYEGAFTEGSSLVWYP